ncbi:OmpW family outer membrane protein [Glaciecola sp. SC05]|uniref:OmpW family outer membrane protein n=1 Tax=Glaciecola sp. SC05 TaxID=1987355 RepID=UPI0035298426
MKKTILSTALVSALALSSVNVSAFEAGDIVVRGGLTMVAPDASSTNILVGGANFALPEVGVVGGVDVDNNTQIGLTVSYFLTDNWNIEVLAATPFSHDIEILGGTKLASTKHLPPTVTANYFFADSDAKFQPYVGVGVNYTVFFDEEFDDAAVGLIQGLAEGATVSDLSLDGSFGLAAQVGADFEISDGMYLNASVRYINIETEASFQVNGADLGSIDTVKINPWVYTISLGYKF